MIKVQYIEQNTKGRDIVISDPHGHYEHIHILMLLLEFDKAVDRFIVAGDLVDRGPQSMKCLELLFQPWFILVRGNHDDNILEVMKSIMGAKQWGMSRASMLQAAHSMLKESNIDFSWFVHWLECHKDWSILEKMIEKLENTCHILVVGEGKHRYNVVHANLIDAGIRSDADIDQLHGSLDQRQRFALLGARSLAKKALAEGSPNKITVHSSLPISPTFCGHNIVPTVISHCNHIFIDTGCYCNQFDWAGLTAIEIPRMRRHFVPANLQRLKVTEQSAA